MFFMKHKIFFIALFFFSLFLISCTTKEDKIRFKIEENIAIELNEYTENYNFSPYIHVFKNDEEILNPTLSFFIEAGSKIEVGEATFYVIYKEDEKEYKEKFVVTFQNSYVILKLHYGSEVHQYEVKKGSTLATLDLSEQINHMKVEGYYLDTQYEKTFDMQEAITKDLELYAKLSYTLSYDKRPIVPSDVAKNMDDYIWDLMENTPSYRPSWNQEGFKGRWNYIDGVFLNSIVNLYHETNNKQYMAFLLNYIDYYIDYEGNFINPETKEPTGYRSGELDSVCESRILFDAYEMTRDPRYLKAIEKTYQELKKMSIAVGSQNFSHKESYLNQIWLDGMYMYVPFLARYAQFFDKPEEFSLIKEQYAYIREHMFDEEKQLYYHGHDTTKSIFWADKTTGNSKSFWLRSNGWFIVSLVDGLEYFPEGEEKNYLLELLEEALTGILQYQDETTHMFYQLVDKGPNAFLVHKEYLTNLKNYAYGNGDATIKNYLESSGSSMIAYAALKASRLGYLKNYEQIGIEIFEGIYDYSFKENSLHHICITAGLGPDKNPYRDGSLEYYLAEPVGENDAKGVGPFIMAYLEYALDKALLKKQINITQVLPTGSREIAFPEKVMVDEIYYPYIPYFVFVGFYYDEAYQFKIPNGTIFTKDTTIYLKYIKEESFYESLLNSDNKLLEENFDSYTKEDSLPEFKEWGTKGIYYYINDKDDPGIDMNLNHIELGNGDAYLYDNSEYDGTQLIIDAGNITKGIVKGYMEVSLEYAGNSWTFFQIYGTKSNGTYGEIFGARFDEGILKYRLDGGNVIYPPYPYIYPMDQKYKIEYIYDLNQNQLSVKMNDMYLVCELHMTSTSFGGIKIVSSDKMAYFIDDTQEKHYVHRRARVDNIILVVE